MKAHAQAASIAREQVAWFKANGFDPGQAMEALGDRAAAFRKPESICWDEVFAEIGAVWLQLRTRADLLQGARRRPRATTHHEARA